MMEAFLRAEFRRGHRMDGLAVRCLEVFAKISSALHELHMEIELKFQVPEFAP